LFPSNIYKYIPAHDTPYISQKFQNKTKLGWIPAPCAIKLKFMDSELNEIGPTGGY
jgi:hypothetical protein